MAIIATNTCVDTYALPDGEREAPVQPCNLSNGLDRNDPPSFSNPPRIKYFNQNAAFLLLAPLAGWFVYLAWMWFWTGNAFEGFQAQKHWNIHGISNLWNIPKFVASLFQPLAWHAYKGSLLDRVVFMVLFYCLLALWFMDKSLFLWAMILGVLPAMSGTFASFTRYASVAFPMFIALGVFLSAFPWRMLK